MSHEHLGYIWAAYKRGSFGKYDGIPGDMDVDEFRWVMTDRLGKYIDAGGSVVMPIVDGIPVGMIVVSHDNNRAYPHVAWFPEATPRLRVDIGARFILSLKKTHLVMIATQEGNLGYFRHLCKYGLLRAVGKVQGYYPDGEDAMLFQSVGQ